MELQQTTLPVLNAQELRVLGVLIEKSRATPEYYPMTINSIVVACNQKTSRKPVVNYDEQTVILTIDSLKKKGWVATVTGGTSRSIKYKHNLGSIYQLMPEELAVICLLLLRGPLTPGEINTNSGRLYEFDSLEEVQAVIEKLSGGTISFITALPRRAGQKEIRYAHLLGGAPDAYQEDDEEAGRPSLTVADLESRLSKVEEELSEMKTAFDKLMKELMG